MQIKGKLYFPWFYLITQSYTLLKIINFIFFKVIDAVINLLLTLPKILPPLHLTKLYKILPDKNSYKCSWFFLLLLLGQGFKLITLSIFHRSWNFWSYLKEQLMGKCLVPYRWGFKKILYLLGPKKQKKRCANPRFVVFYLSPKKCILIGLQLKY